MLLLVGWLVGFLTSSSTTRLYRGRAPRQSVWQFYVLPHMRQSWETMTSVSADRIILTPTQPVGSGRPQRESNPGPPHQESRALPTELPRPPMPVICPHLHKVMRMWKLICNSNVISEMSRFCIIPPQTAGVKVPVKFARVVNLLDHCHSIVRMFLWAIILRHNIGMPLAFPQYCGQQYRY